MTRFFPVLAAGLSVFLLVLPARADDLRVMTFNIRYANPNDGENAWPLRRELFFKTIEAFDPDLLGLQEVTPLQNVEINERLKACDSIGLPRDDGKLFGERSPVLFKRDRFEKVAGGTFWLSPTPQTPGSKGWDAQLPRVCSWVELRDKKNGGKPIFFFNTHFDHKGPTARLESAKLMRAKVTEIAGEKTVVITGDFNTPQKSEPYTKLLGDNFTDAFAEAKPEQTKDDFTFHGFTGKSDRGNICIDWILHSAGLKTKSCAIDRANENGKYPSDHFPLAAVFDWP